MKKTLSLFLLLVLTFCASASVVWVAQVSPGGKLIGVFDDYTKAKAACDSTNACVFPVELNRHFGTNFIETGVIYPKR